MSCTKQIEELIGFFDTYATSFQVQFRNKSTFQTNFGGIISFILILFGLAALILLYIFLESRDEQKIVTFKQKYSDPPEFYMSSNYSNITYSTVESNYGFFFYSISFIYLSSNKAMTLEQISDTLQMTVSESYYEKGNRRVDIPKELKQCKELYPNINTRFNNSQLGDSYCINNTKRVQGEFISDTYRYILFRLTKQQDNEDISEFLSKIKVLIYRSDYTIDTNITKDTPITYIIKPIEIPLENNVHYEADIYVSFNKFKSNDYLYGPWNAKKIQTCYKVNKIHSRSLPISKQRLMSLFLRSSFQYEQYQRNFKSFFDMLSQLGGVWKVFLFVGAVLVTPLNLNLMNVSISNKLFNMIHPNNEDEVQMTYEEYERKEEEYEMVPEIFKSLNPVLKRISIEYYRYERNKGMDFTLNEALGKMCCCFCKIKSLRTKDMIFKSSGREIEKRLDIVKVAKFAQELKAMKKIVLYNHTSFLDYNSAKDIDYSLLGKIRQEYNEKYAFSKAKPLSIVAYKQNLLVSAFNIMRNQGDLTKVDLLIIKLFNLNPQLVMKFFITYSDRFNLIYTDDELKKIGQDKKLYKDYDKEREYPRKIRKFSSKKKSKPIINQ